MKKPKFTAGEAGGRVEARARRPSGRADTLRARPAAYKLRCQGSSAAQALREPSAVGAPAAPCAVLWPPLALVGAPVDARGAVRSRSRAGRAALPRRIRSL
jgi:hypothetical protein